MIDPEGEPGASIGAAPAPSAARGWRLIVASVAALLIGTAVAGLAALAFTVQVGDAVSNALTNDIELEDEADDLRAAILDMRHYHRNLVFTGPTRSGLTEFDAAYVALREELDELADARLAVPGIVDPDDLETRVREYYDAFRPAIELHTDDPAAFEAASDAGLAALSGLEQEAQSLEDLSETLSEAALQEVRDTIGTSVIVLLVILIGLGAVGVGLAVTAVRVLGEQRRLYAAQQATAERLEHALRARTDFIADASHELRTPLTVLRGNAEVGLAAGATECGHEAVLREIVAESERMTQLVEDLLLLARYDAGAISLEARDVDIEPWFAEVAARGEILARERGVSLAPSVRAEGRVRVDARRLDQAVMVLLDNATKHSPAGGTVRLEASMAGSSLVIEVTDQGRGIPADALPFIFERFNRGDRSHGETRGGAGLGLSIARAIVTAHDGTISARSRAGEGTTMTIIVPLAPPSDSTAADPGGPSRAVQGATGAEPPDAWPQGGVSRNR